MIESRNFMRTRWGSFPADVTSTLPSQRSGSSDRQGKTEYKPIERPVDKPAAAPPKQGQDGDR